MDLSTITQMSEEQVREFFERLRWPNGVSCPFCNKSEIVKIVGKSARKGLIRCRACRKQFTVTVGTIFEDTRIALRKWLMAIHLICSSKKGISALQLQRNLGIGSYETAWHMAHRIRFAMKQGAFDKMLRGAVEVDETYVGGKKRGGKRGRGSENKTPVLVLVERSGNARTKVIEHVDRKTLHGEINTHVNPDSTIITDDWPAYKGIGTNFIGGHQVVRHSIGEYAKGTVNTNTAECYFSLLKRGIIGVFHQVSRKHLHRYCDEFSFRWDRRKDRDIDRTVEVLRIVEGKRLMYKELVDRSKPLGGWIKQ